MDLKKGWFSVTVTMESVGFLVFFKFNAGMCGKVCLSTLFKVNLHLHSYFMCYRAIVFRDMSDVWIFDIWPPSTSIVNNDTNHHIINQLHRFSENIRSVAFSSMSPADKKFCQTIICQNLKNMHWKCE